MATLPHTAAASRGAGPFTVHPKVEHVCDRVSQVFVFQQTLRRSHSHTIQIQSGKSLLVPTNEAAATADPPNRIFVEKGLLSTFLIDSFIHSDFCDPKNILSLSPLPPLVSTSSSLNRPAPLFVHPTNELTLFKQRASSLP